MRVLGVDPGYERLGVAILEKAPKQIEVLLFSGCLRTDAKQEFSDRLLSLGREFTQIIKDQKPSHMAMEGLFFTNNKKTAMRVAEVRGLLIYLAKNSGLEVFEYNPLSIKTALTGYGKATKQQVEAMVRQLIRLDNTKRIDDEMDAIAVALTHLAHKQSNYPQN